MSEPITIPADFDLPRAMPDTWDELHAWYEANEVRPGQVTASRPVIMTADSIGRWEIVDGKADGPFPTNVSKRGQYELADGEEWTHDDDFAIAIHHVVTPVVTPLPDHLRAALATALA